MLQMVVWGISTVIETVGIGKTCEAVIGCVYDALYNDKTVLH